MSATLITLLASTFVAGREIIAAVNPATNRAWPARYDDLDAVLRAHIEGESAPAAAFRFLARGREVRLTGHPRVGAYNLDQNGCVRWACFDLDGSGHKYPLADATATMLALVSRVRAAGHIAHVERSGGGAGWHVWLFFAEPVSAADVRAALLPIVPDDAPLASGGFADVKQGHGIELFPKQDKLKPNKKGGQSVGSQVWMPFWWGAKPGGNVFYDVDGNGVRGVIAQPVLTATSVGLIAAEAAARRAAKPQRAAFAAPPLLGPDKARGRVAQKAANIAELSEALDAAIRANASKVSRSGSTLRCNAWWRGGDDLNVHVDLAKGTWFDHKVAEGGGVRDLAYVLGMSLPQFLAMYGGAARPAPAHQAPARREMPPLFTAADVGPLWDRFVDHQCGPCGACDLCRNDERCVGRPNAARVWLTKGRGIPDDVVIDSGVVTLDRESVNIAADARRAWLSKKLAENGTAALAPLRNAETGVVENLVLRYLSPADPKLKSQNLPGVQLRAGAVPRGYGLVGGAQRADLVIITEGFVDTLCAEVALRSYAGIVVVGALSATEIETWARWLLTAKAEVVIAPHLDHSDAGDAHGTGQDHAVGAAAILRSAGRKVRMFRWTRARTELARAGVADVMGEMRDLGDIAALVARGLLAWPDVVRVLRLGFEVTDA